VVVVRAAWHGRGARREDRVSIVMPAANVGDFRAH
jgi:hypothetical protein